MLNIVLEALVENAARENAALATLAGQPQFPANLAKLCGTSFNGFPDLAISNRIAHANVHKIAQVLFIIYSNVAKY